MFRELIEAFSPNHQVALLQGRLFPLAVSHTFRPLKGRLEYSRWRQ